MSDYGRFGPHRVMVGMSAKWFRRAMRLFPPMRHSGVRVTHVSDDYRHWRMELPLRLRTRNFVGTHWGGTLYSAADSQFMLAWMQILGPEYIVWDKAATVRFKRPGRGRLWAEFTIAKDEIATVQAMTAEGKVDRTYGLAWRDRDGNVVCEVDKVLHFRRKATA